MRFLPSRFALGDFAECRSRLPRRRGIAREQALNPTLLTLALTPLCPPTLEVGYKGSAGDHAVKCRYPFACQKLPLLCPVIDPVPPSSLVFCQEGISVSSSSSSLFHPGILQLDYQVSMIPTPHQVHLDDVMNKTSSLIFHPLRRCACTRPSTSGYGDQRRWRR